MTALIEAGFPVKTGDALDLIERLIRPSDRCWCLAALIDRGGLRDIDVDRAMAMTRSATLRQRIRRVSTVAL